MTKAGPSTHVLVELASELPGGFRDLQKIHSTVTEHGGEIWEEYNRRDPDAQGRWRNTSVRALVWVPRGNYRAFATSMGMLQKKGKLRLTATTYL